MSVPMRCYLLICIFYKPCYAEGEGVIVGVGVGVLVGVGVGVLVGVGVGVTVPDGVIVTGKQIGRAHV